MRYKIFNTILVCCFGCMLSSSLKAQDSIATIKKFIEISDAYKNGSMYADVQIKSSAIYSPGVQDTADNEIQFYLTTGGAYMKYGPLEELVNDSVMLMVNSAASRMILLPNQQSVKLRLRTYMGMLMGDSSVQNIAGKYTAVSLSDDSGRASIELASKVMAFGSSLPKEIILMEYKEKSGQPTQISHIKRTLVTLDSSQYTAMNQDPKYMGRLLSPGNGKFFLINDRTTTFTYKKIMTGDKVQLPVKMSDRIIKDGNGNYVPAAGYENYLLSKQN